MSRRLWLWMQQPVEVTRGFYTLALAFFLRAVLELLVQVVRWLA